ncbi:hypothetical protein IQ238_14480 [Pleurocapsales cyanobacterium LEGE 06147]|nr:hypothetical protein [Pleurocapsales cyanobacterium LEGE 06147]
MMTHIPTPVRTNNQKVSGTFYPLQKEELIALRKSRLINNAAYVHLALRFENPFCDRPIELAPKEFALRWTIPESSVYEALGRLKKLEIVNIKTGKIVISWADCENTALPARELGSRAQRTQQAENSDNPESLWDSGEDSGNSESILGSQNKLQDLRINSDISENCGSEPLSNKDSGSSQTLQTSQKLQTLQTERAASENEMEDKRATVEKQVKQASERPSSKTKSTFTPLFNVLADPKIPVKEKPPRTENDCEITESPARELGSRARLAQKRVNSVNECDLPQDLKNKLEELEIPLDAKVRKAIARHHISQAYGAAAHVERTRATIDNPRGVFLFQLSRQPIEQLGTRGQVRTARDFVGYTIEHIQKMYPHNWQEAARYFGLE